MKRAILSLLLWLAAIEVAYALDLYVATTGSDVSNTCQIQATPCLTGQHAVDQTVFGSGVRYDLHFADGTYYGAINVAYWRLNDAQHRATSLRPIVPRVERLRFSKRVKVSAQDVIKSALRRL